jgi:hypothetical protein
MSHGGKGCSFAVLGDDGHFTIRRVEALVCIEFSTGGEGSALCSGQPRATKCYQQCSSQIREIISSTCQQLRRGSTMLLTARLHGREFSVVIRHLPNHSYRMIYCNKSNISAAYRLHMRCYQRHQHRGRSRWPLRERLQPAY